MVTLRVVVDGILERSPRGIARYSEELTRALIATAPRGCDVEGVVSALLPDEENELRSLLPGLADIHRLPLGRRELRTAWQRGLTTRPLGGMVHSPSLFAPLSRHDRRSSPGEQTVVTIHDVSPWTYPDEDPHAAWVRHMAKRARKYADAIVVPTHATADALSDHIDFGDRVRVIAGAVSGSLARAPLTPSAALEALDLPEEFVLAVGTLAPRKGLETLMRASASASFPVMPLVIVGPPTWGGRSVEQAAFESGAPEGRIRHLPPLPDELLAAVIAEATVMVVPSLHEGFGLPAVEAMHFGTPLIHSDDAALIEVVAGAGVAVPREPSEDYAERLAEVISSTTAESTLLDRLSVLGRDRSRAFSWADSAERTWQLHAEL